VIVIVQIVKKIKILNMCKSSGKCDCNITSITKGEKGDRGAQGIQGPTGPGGADFLFTKVSLTASEIKSASSTPITAISSGGLGTAIEIISMTVNLIYGSVKFDGTTYIYIGASTASAGAAMYYNIISYSANRFIKGFPLNPNLSNLVENDDIVLYTSQDSVGGDSSLDVYITYRIITL
jgi:hypothetical protein